MFEDQIACADLVILSKSDLIDAAGAARANAVVGRHLPRAVKIVPSTNGKVDASILLGLGLAVEDESTAARPTMTTSSTTSMTNSTASSSRSPVDRRSGDLARRVRRRPSRKMCCG